MILSVSAQKIINLVKEALDKSYITKSQYEEIFSTAYEDGYLDRQEQSAHGQLNEILQSGIIRLVSVNY